MKISLSSLSLVFAFTFSAFACNQSHPFNQNANSSEKIKIDSSIGADNAEKIKTGIVEPNRYRLLRDSIFIGANIASMLISHRIASLVPEYYMEENRGNRSIDESIMVFFFTSQILVNALSALIPHEEDKATIGPQSDRNVKTGIFVGNALFATLNFVLAVALTLDDPSSHTYPFVFAFQAGVNTANCILQRSWLKKNKNKVI